MKKFISLLLAVLVLAGSMSLIAYAAESYDDLVAPCYNNTSSASVSLNINSSGKATITLNCRGVSGKTTKIVAESKIQKKFGLIWINVSGASWDDTANTYYMSKSHTYQLDDTGTYRAKVTYTVSGSGGANDVITLTDQDTY